MTLSSELDGNDDEANKEHNAKKAPPLKKDDKVVIVLEALPACTGWKQIFHLLEELCEQISITIPHGKGDITLEVLPKFVMDHEVAWGLSSVNL